MGALILFLKVWQPKELWLSPQLRGKDESAATMAPVKPMDKTPLTQSQLWSAMPPWIIVCVPDADLGERLVQDVDKLDLYLELSRS
jgi:lactate permease